MKNNKVVIAIPSMEMVHADFAVSLAGLVAYSCTMPGMPQIMVFNKQRSRIEVARTGLVHMAKEAGASHILFLDSDMTFPPNTLYRLMVSDRDIIGCNAARRENPPTAMTDIRHEGISRVPHLGFGVMLIDLAVFDRLPSDQPWFMAEWEGDKIVGEDMYFCALANSYAMDVWCHHGLSRHIGHLGQRKYMLEDCGG